jgi:hypothetical protein
LKTDFGKKYGTNIFCKLDECCIMAAQCGNLMFLEYVCENLNYVCRLEDMCIAAARNGHLECLKYAHEHGCAISEYVYEISILTKHIECFKYAYENSALPRQIDPCLVAAKTGCVEVLEYMFISKQYKIYRESIKICRKAAANGHLECLKYAHEHGCHWNSTVCIAATKNGHLECLRYAHENGCPWSKKLRWGMLDQRILVSREQINCLEYARNNGCSSAWNSSSMNNGEFRHASRFRSVYK